MPKACSKNFAAASGSRTAMAIWRNLQDIDRPPWHDDRAHTMLMQKRVPGHVHFDAVGAGFATADQAFVAHGLGHGWLSRFCGIISGGQFSMLRRRLLEHCCLQCGEER